MHTAALQQMVDYNYWAHRRVWRCIELMTDKQFLHNLEYSVGSIRNQVVHTMSYERVYLLRLQGNPSPKMLAYVDFPNRPSVRQKWDAIEIQVRTYVDSLTDESLDEVISYYSVGGQPYHDTRLQLLMHVINHGTDHRAQTLAMLHMMSVPTVPQDYIYYLRDLLPPQEAI